MTDYTPTTEDVRAFFGDTWNYYYDEPSHDDYVAGRVAAFDRWLTDHDTTTRVETMQELARSGMFAPHDIATLQRLAELTLRGDN